MPGVIQSGQITRGHRVNWETDGVIGDGGPALTGNRVLGSVFMASFNTTTDQPVNLLPYMNAFQLTGIIVTNASIPLTAAAGGFYPLPGQAGSPLVLSSQIYNSLSSPDKLLQVNLTAFSQTTRFSRAVLTATWAVYFSLTTPQGSPATADIYVLGVDLSA